ncbi:DUF5719 family protein [Streptomyces sedi]|uniref:DUF5719 family protein n=1 Tax=Streptomyces sedi TaxID=555059 RepID=UPI00147755FA|nr:DUF5719 family protein [Streptomyces sedi]
MNRLPLPLLGVLVALLALTGVATMRGDAGEEQTTRQAQPLPVERTALTCPRPTGAAAQTTWYTGFTPPTESVRSEEGAATLLPAPEHTPDPGATDPDEDGGGSDEENEEDAEAPEPVLELTEPGLPVTATVDDADAPALTGTADHLLAPGWTVQQTTVVDSGEGKGALGTSCQTPDTEFWFTGASAAEDRHDYVHVTNPDEAATVVDIEVYGAEGELDAEQGQGITVPGHSGVAIRLATLLGEAEPDLAVHVAARSGRVGAQIEVVDESLGTDWLPPVTDPAADTLVLPGIPAGVNGVRLSVFAPGGQDVSLNVGLAGPGGTITPAGNESVNVVAGTVTTVELGDLTQGEASSLVLTRQDGTGSGPVVASLHVVAGGEGDRESAFLPATEPIDERATISGNTTSGTRLALLALDETVEVDLTYSAGADGGEPVTETYTVDPGTTVEIAPELDGTEGNYAITLEPSGGGTLHAARTLLVDRDGATAFTTQTIPDDGSTVSVPETDPDLSLLVD